MRTVAPTAVKPAKSAKAKKAAKPILVVGQPYVTRNGSILLCMAQDDDSARMLVARGGHGVKFVSGGSFGEQVTYNAFTGEYFLGDMADDFAAFPDVIEAIRGLDIDISRTVTVDIA